MKKQFKRYLAFLLVTMLVFSSAPLSAAAQGTDAGAAGSSPAAAGNSVRVGTKDSLSSYISKPLQGSEAITADDYYISFDYFAPDDKHATYYFIFGAQDAAGKNILDIQQINQDVQINISGFPKITGILKYGQWQNFTLHFKNDEISLYIDGVLQQVAGSNTFKHVDTSSTKVAKIFGLGDRSSAGVNGYAYYDNFRVVQNGTQTTCDTFDAGTDLSSAGWVSFPEKDKPNDIACVSDQNCPLASLSSMTAKVKQSASFKPGEKKPVSECADVTALLTSGAPAIDGMASAITYTSSTPDIMDVTQETDGTYLSFKAEGVADLKITYTLLGVTREMSLLLYVNSDTASSVRVGTKDSLSSTISKPLQGSEAVTSDDYYISFDYHQSTDRESTYMYIFGALDSAGKSIVEIQQVNKSDVQINLTGSYPKLRGVLKSDQWQNFTLHFKSGEISLYIDGVLQQVNGANTFKPKNTTSTTVAKISGLGDGSSAANNGYAYYDNFRVVQNGQQTTMDDFNTGKSLSDLGWTASTEKDKPEEIGLDTAYNCPIRALDSISIDREQIGFKTNDKANTSDIMTVKGTINDGAAAVMGMGTLSYQSLDPTTISITEENGQSYFNFLKEGKCNVIVSCTMFGITRSYTLEYIVSDTIETTGYEISNATATLTRGTPVALQFVKTLSNGLTENTAMQDIPDFTVESSNTSAITVEKTDTGATLSPLAGGDSSITIHYTLNGKACSASKSFRVMGNSLRTGASSSLYGYAWKKLYGTSQQITADDYFISYDYCYPSDVKLNNFNVWRSLDDGGAVTGTHGYMSPSILQTGSTLTMYVGGFPTPFVLTGSLTADVWHNIALHFKGMLLEVYIDGKAIQLGASTYVDRGTNLKIPAIGHLGDVTKTDANGYAWYDNIKVVQNGVLTTNDTFDDDTVSLSSLGWLTGNSGSTDYYPNYSNPSFDAPSDVLDSLAVSEKQTGFQKGKTVPISKVAAFTPMLMNGHPVVDSMGSFSYSSTDTNVMEVEKDTNGNYNLKFNGEGSCSLNASYTLGGVTKTASVALTVSAAAQAYGISFSNTRDYILNGESIALTFLSKYNDGTSEKTTADRLENLSIVSSDSSIASVSQNGSVYSVVGGGTNGTATITLSCTLAGKTVTASKTFTTVSINSIGIDVKGEPIYVSDTDKIVVTAKLSNGIETTAVGYDSLKYSFSQSGVAQINSDGRFEALGACTGFTVTLTAGYNGKTYTASDTVTIKELVAAKTKSTYYTLDKISAAVENISQYKWAKTLKDAAVTKADNYLAKLSYKDLWENITSEGLPRAHAVNEKMGSLVTGHKLDSYGTYPYTFADGTVDWKITDPSCNIQFPTNDFKSYYEGGLDENGVFSASLAKQHNDELIAAGGTGNLVNVSGYHTDDPAWGVDDGTGYIDPATGEKYPFVAYYNQWYSWYAGTLKNAREALTDAYIYTGEQKYADAVIVMLDRIADVYPDMDLMNWKAQDGYFNGNPGDGKVTDYVWENTLLASILKSYDAIFPAIGTMGQEAKNFLASKSTTQDKSNPTRIKINFENGVLRQILPAIKKGQIAGNNGMFQSTLALAAVVLDHYPETQEMLNFDFRSGVSDGTNITGGNIETILVDSVSNDGQGDEGSIGYNAGWLTSWLAVADVLNGYKLPNDVPLDNNTQPDLFRNVKFKKMFYAMYPLLLNDIYVPNIGDTGQTGKPDTYCITRSEIIRAYQVYGDPVLAQVTYLLNKNTSRGLKYDIFTRNPESLAQSVQDVIEKSGELDLGSNILGGAGFAALRDGTRATNETPSGMSYDFYNLDISNVTEGTPYRYLPNYYSTFQFQAKKTGDTISFDFDFEGDASQAYHLFLQKPPSTGIYGYYDVSINGNSVVKNMNFSNEDLMNADVGAVTGLKKGKNTITFTCTGVSPGNASSYVVGIRTMTLFVPSSAPVEAKENTQRDLWITYGMNGKHDHKDALNLGLAAYQLDLMPDLGYPQYADEGPERRFWVDSTLSHNTVVVDGKQQDNSENIGKPTHFDDSDFVKLFDVEANNNYASTDLYKRTSAMIKIDGDSSYIVDLFRVKGGSKHEFSFHSADGNITTSGLNLTGQPGTYDGPGTMWGQLPSGESTSNNIGYFWLKNVQQDKSPASQFSIDWQVKDTWNVLGKGTNTLTDTHLKLTMLGNYGTVTLADGCPPVKPGNPESLKYLVVKNQGSNLDTAFTSVIEPYKQNSNIGSIEQISVYQNGSAVNSNDVKAVKVTLKNGRTDYIVSALDTSKTYTVKTDNGSFDFCGYFGVYSVKDGKVTNLYVNDGTQIADKTSLQKEVTGQVADFTKDLTDKNTIDIKLNQETDLANLTNRYIYIKNDIASKNAVYKILGAAKLDNGSVRLDVGNVTTVGSWVNKYDFSKGYNYLMAAGDTFTIPLSSCTAVGSTKISGAENNGTYFNGRTICYESTAAAIVSATVNGAAFNSGTKFTQPGVYNVEVTDKSGNVSKLTFTIQAIPKASNVNQSNLSQIEGIIAQIKSQITADATLTDADKQALQASADELQAAADCVKAAAEVAKGINEMPAQPTAQDVLALAGQYALLGSDEQALIPAESKVKLLNAVNSTLRTDSETGIFFTDDTGSLPLNVQLNVTAVPSTNEEYAKAVSAIANALENGKLVSLVNIRLLSNGSVYTLHDGQSITVSVPVPNDYIGKNVQIACIADDGTVTLYDTKVVNEFAVFTTNHLSTWALVEKTAAQPSSSEPSSEQPSSEQPSSEQPSSSDQSSSQSDSGNANTGDSGSQNTMLIFCLICLLSAVGAGFLIKRKQGGDR